MVATAAGSTGRSSRRTRLSACTSTLTSAHTKPPRSSPSTTGRGGSRPPPSPTETTVAQQPSSSSPRGARGADVGQRHGSLVASWRVEHADLRLPDRHRAGRHTGPRGPGQQHEQQRQQGHAQPYTSTSASGFSSRRVSIKAAPAPVGCEPPAPCCAPPACVKGY
jgi:hypothetical protein